MEKYGTPSPAAKITTRPFSRWRVARQRTNGSATCVIAIADWTRVGTWIFSKASCRASAFMMVASMPM